MSFLVLILQLIAFLQLSNAKISINSKFMRKATATFIASLPLAFGPIAAFADAIPTVGNQ